MMRVRNRCSNSSRSKPDAHQSAKEQHAKNWNPVPFFLGVNLLRPMHIILQFSAVSALQYLQKQRRSIYMNFAGALFYVLC